MFTIVVSRAINLEDRNYNSCEILRFIIIIVVIKVRGLRRADNLAAICEPIFYTMWDPSHLTTILASTACYGDRFTFPFFILLLL
jgi:hypothetical protein